MDERAEKCIIPYEVARVGYNFGTGMDEPHIVLQFVSQLKNFKFEEGNQSRIYLGEGNSIQNIWLYLNKSTFHRITGRIWDGTEEDAKRLGNEMTGQQIGKLEFKFNI